VRFEHFHETIIHHRPSSRRCRSSRHCKTSSGDSVVFDYDLHCRTSACLLCTFVPLPTSLVKAV